MSGTTKLTWWQLADAVPAHVRHLVTGAVVGTTSALAAGVLGVMARQEFPLHAFQGLAFGMFVGVLVSRATSRWRPGLLRYRLKVTRKQWGNAVPALWFSACAWVVGTALGAPGPVVTAVAALMALAGVATSVFVVVNPVEAAANPERVLAESRRSALISCAITSGLGVAGAVLLDQTALGVAAVGVPVVLLASAWGRWLLFVRFWLPVRGRLPWSYRAFTAEACKRGVLRQSGAIHQFRHALVREGLTQSADLTPERVATAP